MSKTYLGLMAVAIVSALASASASARADDKPCKNGECKPPREICLNVFCEYQKASTDEGFAKCQAAAKFTKEVTGDGDEMEDEADHEPNAAFEVACDEEVLFNNSAHRFTDRTGTRLQAESGPYPSVLLPKGALRDWHSYVPSSLELDGQTLHGFCYVYSGAP